MGVEPKPPADIEIDRNVVDQLLASQMPDLAGRDLVELASGWDNSIWRLGDDLVVRLPRRLEAVELVTNEQRWLSTLAPALPLPIPVPLRHGHPSERFPRPWSVIRWMDGEPASVATLSDPARGAGALGSFLAALHRPSPDDGPRNPYRGIALIDRKEQSDRYLERIAADGLDVLGGLGGLDVDEITQALRRCESVAPWGGPPMWVHGDLHPANVLVHRGEISAVLDFGDVCCGDPATDLAIAWMLFESADRSHFRDALAMSDDDDLWERGRGWAIGLSLAYLAHSANAPSMAAIGRRGLIEAVRDGGQRSRS